VGALDGLRGVAVISVILFHGGVTWLGGGFLGVELFFVLSGFLITSLLLAEWLERGTIALGAFWARRARRLLPALVLLVIAIGVYTAAGNASVMPGLFGNGLAALLYYSNWHQIAAGTNYFAASGPVSPFQHTWSLAIEEQFYALWPPLVLASVWVVRRSGGSRSGTLRGLLLVALAGVVASAVQNALMFDGGTGLDRVYYGTDTRATGLLAGAALAILLALRRTTEHDGEAQPRAGRFGRQVLGPAPARALAWVRGHERVAWGAVAIVALAVVLYAMRFATGSSAWMFPWGLLMIDLATVAVIASVVAAPGTIAERLLSARPLRATGRISYGLYLWHFPLFLWLDADDTGVSGVRLLALRVAITVGASVASYVLVEQPIRRRRCPAWLIGSLAPAGVGAAVASLFVASVAGALPNGPSNARIASLASSRFAGNGPACTVSLVDRPGYGVAPVPMKSEQAFEFNALGDHSLVWHGSAAKRFTTCPPKRILVIGDSIAFTIGLPMLEDEQSYGVEVANAAILGCAFSTRGDLDVNGVWQSPETDCASALPTWTARERQFHPDEVVIELGYRDEFDWRWNGRVVHLGEPNFDAYVQRQIDQFVSALRRGGTKILLLSVPFTDPPALSNGDAAPAASIQRHKLINSLLARAAVRAGRGAAFVDVDKTLSPHGHYTGELNGQVCRFDGVHISLFCANLLQEQILPAARRLLGK
jgi:peptidoglycan/LPS O-acetylase OafA/YrhL